MCLQLQVSSADLYCPFKIIFNGVNALEKEWQEQNTYKSERLYERAYVLKGLSSAWDLHKIMTFDVWLYIAHTSVRYPKGGILIFSNYQMCGMHWIAESLIFP